MDLSHLVNVALGLIFFYLLLSLVCTAGNELMASFLQRRSATLEQGIEQILGQLKKKDFYEHPLITMLSAKDRTASYIPAQTFSSVVLDLLAPATTGAPRVMQTIRTRIGELYQAPDPAAEGKETDAALQAKELQRRLLVMLDDAKDDVAKLRTNLETMFDHAMDRVAGVYKRRTQFFVLVWAFAVTLATNADTIRVGAALSRDAEGAAAIAKYAREFSARADSATTADSTHAAAGVPPDTGSAARAAADSAGLEGLKRAVADLQASGLPIGWASTDWPEWLGGSLADAKLGWVLSKLLGFLITAAAVSLGAPFWFDMLGKVVRATGKVPARAAAPR